MTRLLQRLCRSIWLAGLLLMAPGCGRPAPEKIADSPTARRRAAERYVAQVPLTQLLEATAEQLAAQREPAQRQALRDLLKREVRRDLLAEATCAALARHFTVAEIEALAAFNARPEAGAIQRKLPAYTADIARPLNAELGRVLALTNAALAALRWQTRVLAFRATAADEHLLAEFPFMNIGTRPVTILSVTSTCACISGRADATNYPPRHGGYILADFAFGPRTGAQVKTLTVRTDDPCEPEVRLQVEVQIPEVVRLEPTYAYWQIGCVPSPSAHRLTLLQPDCEVTGLLAGHPDFCAQLFTHEPGRSYTVQVSPSATTRRAFAQLELLVRMPGNHTRRFPLFAVVDVARPTP